MGEVATAGLTDLDRRVAAFEAAWAVGERPDLGRFLPPTGDPEYALVLTELVRIDLELRCGRGESAGLDRYRTAYPDLFADPARVRELAFEEYRLRAAAGERPHPQEYADRFGIDTARWPTASPGPTGEPPRFPEPEESVLDFRLVRELGRGSFGRVFLAEQGGLAGRRVAVKLSTRFGRAEPETLARLQHTHIVPIYSAHRAGPFQVVVMPFLGATTLADVLAELRRRGPWPATGRALADTLSERRSRTLPESDGSPTAAPPAADKPGVAAEALARFTFPEAVLWVGARLADALAHAHDRGILHRDVKPANVLLTDDGQPMLLDFNLAAGGQSNTSGGTPAYMAPEQLRQWAGEPAAVDGRADVYALGLVLFELFTGRPPFPGGDTAANILRGRTTSPGLRAINPAVSPATEAIVRRCLDPDPARRYPSARALGEDLQRQLTHRPLAHTREASVRERFRKWRRRHPRLASSGTVAIAAAIAILAVAGVGFAWYERAKHLERERIATEDYRAFRAAVPAVIEQVAFHGNDPGKRSTGVEQAQALLDRYGAPDDPGWDARPAAALLPEADRRDMRVQLAELLVLLARATASDTTRLDATALIAALELNDRAEAAFRRTGAGVPVSIRYDRAELLRRSGKKVEKQPESVRADETATARDFYLSGLMSTQAGDYRTAVELLETAVEREPSHYWSWFALGNAQSGLGRDPQAEGCYHACVALRPDLPMAYYNRGLCRFRMKHFAAAEADLTTTHLLRPDRTDALINRSLVRLELGRPADAAADVSRAIDLGVAETRLYFVRAIARDRAGDKAGAAADRATGLARKPSDEASWVTRGNARAAGGDIPGAMADFDAALALNPRSFEALQNKASVLDAANRPADAIAVLDRAIKLYPDNPLSRAGRAVLLARRGHRATAHADAEHCLRRGPDRDIVYQLAGVYALTSRTHPEDSRTAFRLLADALRQNYGLDLVDTDRDLDPVRELPEFRLVVEAARKINHERRPQ